MLQACLIETVRGTVPAPVALPVAGSAGDYGLTSDLQLAAMVQRHLQPRISRQPRTARYAGTSTPSRAIGGDYYDFMDLGDGTFGVVLADVSGKGIAAALLMANLQSVIRCECARGFTDLQSMLQRVNAHFFASTLEWQYATLFFGRYDDRTRRLEYINCGQQPVMVVRADGWVETLETTAMPVGVVEDWAGETRTVELLQGDSFFACSDGVTEAGIANGMEFGEAGLVSVIASSPHQDIELDVQRIAQAARLYDGGEPADDMTVVGMRFV